MTFRIWLLTALALMLNACTSIPVEQRPDKRAELNRIAQETVEMMVSAYPEVNHNYEREHSLNLWFVVTAPDSARLQQVLDDIASRSGYEVLPFPLLEDYHIDLGFDLKWT